MACTLTGVSQNDTCISADGGIKSFYVAGFTELDTVTATANEISAITLALSSTLTKFVPDEQDGQLNEEGSRQSSRLTNVVQNLNVMFQSLSAATSLSIEQLEQCCEGFVVFVVHNQTRAAGTEPVIRVLGLQMTDASGGFKQIKMPLRTGDFTIDSGTVDSQSQNTLAFSGTATKPAPFYTGTVASLDALT